MVLLQQSISEPAQFSLRERKKERGNDRIAALHFFRWCKVKGKIAHLPSKGHISWFLHLKVQAKKKKQTQKTNGN